MGDEIKSEEKKTEGKVPESFLKKFSEPTLNQVEETTSTTTAAESTETTTDTTTETTTETTTAAKSDEPEKKPKIRRAKGFEDVPELVDSLKDAADSMREAAKEMKAKPEPKPATDDFQYTEEETYQISVLETMEEMDPKYKGVASKAREQIKVAAAIEQKVLKENPNATPEEIDEAIAEQQEKSGLKWSQVDFRRAEIRREMKPIEEEKETLKKKVSRIEAEEHHGKVAPKAKEYSAQTVRDEVVVELGDEFKTLIKDGVVDDVALEKLSEEDPLIAKAVKKVMADVGELSEATYATFNGAKTELTNEVIYWAKVAEAELLKLPKTDQVNEKGQQFVPRAVWNKMTPEQKAEHWVVGPEEIVPIMANQFVTGTKAYIEEVRARDKKKFPTPEPPPKKIDKPISPTSDSPVIPVAAPTAPSAFAERMKRGTA